MSDFVSGFWNLYVAGIVVVSLLFCLILLWTQGKYTMAPGETTGHVWDETLQEYNNPLPGWWRWLFYFTIAFSVLYLVVYPGFGSTEGSFGWSSSGQYDKEMKDAEQKYGPVFDKYKNQDLATVAASSEARDMGQRLFVTYCAQCHGADARGSKGFPNLTDKDWLWGGSAAKIKESIIQGRDAMMPAKGLKPDLDAEQIRDIANYVRSLSSLDHDAIRMARGKELFAAACAACHGPDGKGVVGLAPNLADTIWLYGSSEETIVQTITAGRTNKMPAFGEFLGEAKVHLLAAYVYGLGGAESESK